MRILARDIYLSARSLILTLLINPFLSPKIQKFDSSSVKRVLFIRLDRIGDIAVSLPAIAALGKIFPKADISLLVREDNTRLLKGFKGIDEIIPYQGFFRTLRQLRRRQFEVAVDPLMDYPLKPAMLAYFSGAGLTAGFDIAARGILFSLKIKPRPRQQHMARHILELISALAGFCGVRLSAVAPVLKYHLGEEERLFVESFMRQNGIGRDEFLVGIHPGAYHQLQRWPVERFSELAQRIVNQFKVKLVVIGSRNEEQLADKILNRVKGAGIKAIGLSLDRLAALTSLMKFFVGNNSGPLHIASAFNIPTVSTMGPTDPLYWRPTEGNDIAIRKDLSCSPCRRKVCQRHSCLESISAEEMFQAVSSQLERLTKGKVS
ncbi:glycosyltransferase family 9 protein [Candidatus Omnitrophota bacterium]